MKEYVIQVTNQGFLLVMIASGPPIIISMMVGLMISIFQATTQIQEQTLTFVPKIVAVFGSLMVFGGWIGAILIRYTELLLTTFPTLIR
ncbi:MAG: flagellar biosynthetic protein FliQ [Deltaproteobacteria bacterium]|nr:flagellar biosynthetic protein FliQ [Deltaproteobacteria bacterium]MBU47271.1 flagellar biosynthetic protein FliQ [Deltaproteobacteria bacterium]|tara:strand:- start:67 stop:333 length:267 start_codon:yes stop_codon:yes gene_type:complete